MRIAFPGPLWVAAAYAAFGPAIVVSLLAWGLPAGALAVVLSAAVQCASRPPRDAADWLSLAAFLVAAGVGVAVMEWLIRNRVRAASPDDGASAGSYLASIVESSNDPILAKDLDGTITSWNSAAARLFGYAAAEIVGKPIALLIPPAFLAEEVEIVARLRHGERIERLETLRVAKDGRVVPVSLTISPVRDRDGAILGASTIVRDITENIRAEQERRLSAARLRTAADAARMTYVQFDIELGWVHVAENFGRVMGFLPRTPPSGGTLDNARSGLLAYVEEPDLPAATAMFDAIVAGVAGEQRFRIRGDDGALRWFDSVWNPEPGRDAKATTVFATLLDITASVENQVALEAAKAKADEILTSIGDGFYALDAEWRFSYFNHRAETMLGKRQDEVLGRRFLDVFPMVEGTAIQANYARVFRDGAPLQFEMMSPILRRWVSFSVYPTREGGISVYFRDVERQKAVEADLVAAKAAAERANVSKSRFLAAASHDLRQPVQALVLLLALIERQVEGNPRAGETARRMGRALDGLNGLLSAILDISRLDAGVVWAVPEVVDLGALLDRLTAEYRLRAEIKGLKLRVVPTRLRTFVDPSLLERVMRNLIDNALRYTPEGSVLVGARRCGERIRLDVLDTGIGIEADRRTEIFEEFVQIGNSGRDLAQGLGLGLAIVARLVDLIGAEIEVDSAVGRGSRFSLYLPAATAPPAASAPASEARDVGGRVLVVEDNAVVRSSLDAMIQEWGYETIVAESGEDALRKAAQSRWRFDGVLSDHRLGAGMTGVELAREVERRAGRAIPALILTGDTAKERIGEISTSGVALLHKPVSADALRRSLAAILRG